MALAAEILLQRTRANQVEGVYKAFRRQYPSAQHLASTGMDRLDETIAPLGLRWRGRHLHALARDLAARGEIPESFEDLVRLPAVGPYAASAYLSLHRDRRAALVDANVVRWLGRMFGFKTHGETRRQRWLIDLADQMTPLRAFKEYNYALLDFTIQICRPHPRCGICPFADGTCTYARGSTIAISELRRPPSSAHRS